MPQNGIGAEHLEPGSLLDGRFEVLSKLGQGGMGVVYEAHHLSMKRSVALKLLRSDLSGNPEKLLRFKNEAKVVSTLDHPNIVRVHSVGLTEDGMPYIAMEMLRGTQLNDYIQENGPLNWRKALPLFIQMADALQYAHEKSIIHRDVKPSNIMLIGSSESESAQVKLVDFGIAKSLMEGAPKLTRTDMMLGSVFYLSPGQLLGRAPDARSDIYSLGCTFYESLTGVPPFVGDTVFDTMSKQASERAAPINKVNPQACVPDDLAYVIDWMMQKESGQRPESMAKVSEVLRSIADGIPLSRETLATAHVADAQATLTPTARRLRGLLKPRNLLLMVGIMLATSAAMLIKEFPKAQNFLFAQSSQRNRAELTLLEAIREKRDKGFPAASITQDIQALANLYVKEDRHLESQVVVERGLKLAQKSGNKENVAQLRLLLGASYNRTGRFDVAEDMLKKSAAAIKEVGHTPLYQQYGLTHLYFLTRRYDDANEVASKTLVWLDKDVQGSESRTRFCREAVDSLCFMNDYSAADKVMQRVSPIIEPPVMRRILQAEIDCMLDRPQGIFDLNSLGAQLEKVHGPVASRYALARARVDQHEERFGAARSYYRTAIEELAAAPNERYWESSEKNLLRLQVLREHLDMLRAVSPVNVPDSTLTMDQLIQEQKWRVKELNNRTNLPSYLLNNEYLP